MKKTIIFLAFAIVTALLLSGTFMRQVDEPKYKVVKTDGDIEIREYPPLIVAEVKVEGERKEAIHQGFQILADYIFGGNVNATQIAMTAPVTEQSQGDHWTIRFMIPASFTLETLPKPLSEKIRLISLPPLKFAVIRFSGTSSDSNLEEHQETLKTYIQKQGLKTSGEPIFAFYNPPWTLPFLRRNEVMMELADKP